MYNDYKQKGSDQSIIDSYHDWVNEVPLESIKPKLITKKYGNTINEAHAKKEPIIENTNMISSSVLCALVALSKIVAIYTPSIFKTENKQKLNGLISDLFPKDNKLYPKLKQSLLCDFTQIILNATDKDDSYKEEALQKSIEKIVNEAKLSTQGAELISKLMAFSLGWDNLEITMSFIEKDTSDNLSALPISLQDDMKSVLLYVDRLLENLPEYKIVEFAKSDQFIIYKKLFKELGLD